MFAVQARDAAWSPTSQQVIEPDTTFFMDPDGDAAAGRTAGFGGLVPPRGVAVPAFVAGKFLKGFAPASTSQFLWMPCKGVLGASEFTVEAWFAFTGDWTTAANITPLAIGGTQSNFLRFTINQAANTVRAILSHLQNPAAPGGYSVVASATISGGQFLANTFYSIAATLKGGTLTLYLNGTSVATATGFVAPQAWDSHDTNEGLVIGGGSGGSGGAVGWTVSDVRVSRRARTPGSAAIIAPGASTVTVSASTTGATIQKLAGAVNQLGTAQVGTTPAEALQLAQGGIQSSRTDKFLTATPIKAGATDGTHPTLGHSGSFSYDWQVVDRSIAYITTSMGAEPYISIDANAQIFGGSVAPFAGSDLTTKRASSSSYSPGPPNNIPSYGTVAGDLVYHVITELGVNVPYWGFWNEPDSAPSDWETSSSRFTDFLNLYGAVAAAVKAAAPSIKFGGPESGWINSSNLWVQQLINYCGTLAAPTGVSAAAQVGGYTGSRTFNGATAWFYKIVARNGSGNSVGSTEVSATPATGGSVLLSWTAPSGATAYDIYAATTTGGQSGATSLLASGLVGITGTNTFTDVGAALTTGAIPASATASGVPLDFVCWHWYDGDLSEFAQVAAQVASWAATAGISTPQLAVTEWCWQSAHQGAWPWWQPIRAATDPGPDAPTDYFLNDWHAGFVAAALVNMQANGIVRSHTYDYLALHTGAPGGLFFDSFSVPQSNYNVLRLWSMTAGNSVLSTTLDLDPGVFAVASKNTGTGKLYVFLASIHYRKTKNQPVIVDVSGFGAADGTNVATYLVDDGHSNAWDAGNAQALLQNGRTSPGAQGQGKVAGGKVGVTLRPRAAALLVIG